LTNDSGECETSADGVVLGRPSRPTGPIEVIIWLKLDIHGYKDNRNISYSIPFMLLKL